MFKCGMCVMKDFVEDRNENEKEEYNILLERLINQER